MNSKMKGNIGEAIILSEFVKRGVQCSIPYGDNARYDLIAEFNGKLNRIQIKFCAQEIINNSIGCPCCSSTNHTTNKNYNKYINDVDYMAYYIEPWNYCCLVPIEATKGRNVIRMRQTPALNGQKEGVYLINDYSFDKILCVETLHDTPELLLEGEDKVRTTM